MSSKTLVLLVVAFLLTPGLVSAAGVTRRFVLATGANSGGEARIPLRYAVSDAVQFSEVMVNMGYFPSRSEAVRQALKHFMTNESEINEALEPSVFQALKQGQLESMMHYR